MILHNRTSKIAPDYGTLERSRPFRLWIKSDLYLSGGDIDLERSELRPCERPGDFDLDLKAAGSST